MKLTQADRKKIETAVKNVEIHTDGEVVPVLVSASDAYTQTRWQMALILIFIASGVYTVLYPIATVDELIYIQVPTAIIGFFLGGIGFIKRSLLGPKICQVEVHQRALQAFVHNGLHNTVNRTGILIMVSLLEHRVEILADSGINKVVEKNVWDDIVSDLIKKIKSKSVVDGLEQAIYSCGEVLKQNFPAQNKNENELSNRLITDL